MRPAPTSAAAYRGRRARRRMRACMRARSVCLRGVGRARAHSSSACTLRPRASRAWLQACTRSAAAAATPAWPCHPPGCARRRGTASARAHLEERETTATDANQRACAYRAQGHTIGHESPKPLQHMHPRPPSPAAPTESTSGGRCSMNASNEHTHDAQTRMLGQRGATSSSGSMPNISSTLLLNPPPPRYGCGLVSAAMPLGDVVAVRAKLVPTNLARPALHA